MLFEDTYKTIVSPAEGIYRDKGSKFIAYAYPITQEEELKPIIASLRALHGKARHFCWAFRLTPDRSVFRLNDDGEPSGTAGRPILNSLLSAELTNMVVVVVRYFGGTLLGVPGLINAYKSATMAALQEAQVVEKTVNDQYQLTFDYLAMNEVMKVLKDEQLAISSAVYDTSCILHIEIRKARLNATLGRLEAIESLKAHYIGTV
jgi:uncharacterized YigZ family protein